MKRTSGFTLIEVLTATVVFTVSMLAGVAVFFYGEKAEMMARQKSFALQVAKLKVEELKNTLYDSLPNNGTTLEGTWPADTDGTQYGVIWTTTQGTPPFSPPMKEMKVEVYWPVNGYAANLPAVRSAPRSLIICGKRCREYS